MYTNSDMIEKVHFIIIILLLNIGSVLAQNDTTKGEYQRYYYPNGEISSEGYVKDGQPNGYWNNYYENGVLRSQGNRDSFLLDGPWKFYDEEGVLRLVINYKRGEKHGKRITYTGKGRIEELFENDMKEGQTAYYDQNNSLVKTVNFEKGRENGLAKIYNDKGEIITIIRYQKGIAVSREDINRYDNNNEPHGLWVLFWKNGNIKEEKYYKNGKLTDYYKKYDRDGNLVEIKKYVDGEEIMDVEEIRSYKIKRDYYPDGSIKVEGTYLNDIADGVRKEYYSDGSLKIAYIMRQGVVEEAGQMDKQGRKQGLWRSYYRSGKTKTEGSYKDDVRIGEWTYYFENGSVEQTGTYNVNGKVHGVWKWYYVTGGLRKEEVFSNGLRNGPSTEYDSDRNIIAQGDFAYDLEDGFWYYDENGSRKEGEYYAGEREGVWNYYFRDSTLRFTGSYIDGYPDGKHIHYYDNGNIRQTGKYVVGRKEGEWLHYTYEGALLLRIEYKNGYEVKYDNVTIYPPYSKSEL